jgi:hypothetical protein
MKYFALPMAMLLTACMQHEDTQPRPVINDKPVVTVLRATMDEEDITDVSLFCIDGVKYVVVPGIGMAVKYYNDGTNDPYPETCNNQQPTK